MFNSRSLKLLNYYNKRDNSIKPFGNIPGPKPLPFVGNIWRYLPFIGNYRVDNLFQNACYNKKRYGPIVREQITKLHTVLHLFDPKDIESLLRSENSYPFRRSHRALLKYRHDRPNMYNDGGLFPENGVKWQRLRRTFQKRLMSVDDLDIKITKSSHVSKQLIAKLSRDFGASNEKVHTNFDRFLSRWAIANALYFFCDVDVDELNESQLSHLSKCLDESLHAIDITELYSDKWQDNPDKCKYFKKLVASQDFLYEFVSKRIETTLEKQQDIKTENHSLLNSWLIVDKINSKDVITLVMDCLLAGIHTNSYSVAFLLKNLSDHLDIQKALMDEISSVLGSELFIDSKKLDRMKLLDNCIRENNRLAPVSIGLGRVTTKDMELRGYNVPAGTMVIVHSQTSSIDKDNFEEPLSFIPDRWSKYKSCPRHERPSPFASLPFGHGSRMCIGHRLADIQMKVLLIDFVKTFSFNLTEPLSTKSSLIHMIDGSMKLKIVKNSSDIKL